jgi:FkbM family methyltransferase
MEKHYTKVLDLLNKTSIPKIKRKAVSETTVRTMTLGLIHRPFHTFKGYSKPTEEHSELFQAMLDLANAINPDHLFSTITINKNVVCSKHKDYHNNGTTMIIGLGDYTGGETVLIDANGEEVEYDIKCKPLYFNGYLTEHYNRPFTGTRYSLMFYSFKKAWDISHRPQDIPIIKEVYHGNAYHNRNIGFGIEPGEHWIDVGAHIGCFSAKVVRNGGTVTAYEPSDNYEYLVKNINPASCVRRAVCSSAVKSATVSMKMHDAGYFNKIVAEANEHTVEVPVVKFKDIVTEDCCIKMDIEGSEMDIIDNDEFTKIKKMVIAYHTNVDPSVENLNKRVEKLRQYFKTVTHAPVTGTRMNFFPNELFIYCIS